MKIWKKLGIAIAFLVLVLIGNQLLGINKGHSAEADSVKKHGPEFKGKIGKTHIDKTVPATFSIEETFDVGEDTGSPIIEDVYAVPFRCEALQKLTVKIGED